MDEAVSGIGLGEISIQELLSEVMEVAMSTGRTEGQRLVIEAWKGRKEIDRALYAGLAAAGYAFQRVPREEHREIILRLVTELNKGLRPDPRAVLEAYRVELGKSPVWVTKIFRRKFEKYLKELFPELMGYEVFQLMQGHNMLDQTQRANLIASTFTGFTNHIYKQSQIARDLDRLKELAVIDRKEKEELRARISALEARMTLVEDWKVVAPRLRAEGQSYADIAEATGVKRDTVVKFLQRRAA